MKTAPILLLAWISSVTAAPAVVWKRVKTSAPVVHTSNDVAVQDLFSDVLQETNDFALPAVVFLVGRNEDGSDGLSKLSSEGVLPTIASKYDHAECIHHHVSGVESPGTVVRQAGAGSVGKALQVTLSEFTTKLLSLNEPEEIEVASNGGLMSKAFKTSAKRARAMKNSNIFIVTVDADTDPAEIDSAVVNAIEHSDVGSVVLSALRSTAEVKRERELQGRRRMERMTTVGRSKLLSGARRLEDGGDGDGNNNNNQDMSGVYYVSMTPNIMAGLLFFLLFIVITYIGVSCMGAIIGQDVYVTKLPPVGREA